MKEIDRTIFKVFLGIMVPVLVVMYAIFAPTVFSAIEKLWNNETMVFASVPLLKYLVIFVIIFGSLSLPVGIFFLAKSVLFVKKITQKGTVIVDVSTDDPDNVHINIRK